MSADVLVLSVPVRGAYPSVNHLGAGAHRGGKKSPEYHDLFEAMFAAARAEIERSGWECAEYPVHATLTLYHRTGNFPDAGNLSKVECDALTAAGVWVDDRLARPLHLDTEYDPAGESRVVVIVRRRFPVYLPKTSPILAKVRKKTATRMPVESPPTPASRETPIVGEKYALCNGERVPLGPVLEKLRKHLGGAK